MLRFLFHLRSPSDLRSAEEHRRSRRRAYNLVVLTVAVTLLNIFVASSLPIWSHQIQRDKEAELIFRGMQYAEAIRVFKAKYGRGPNSLKELIEVEPRCIRKLWENPMREDGRWGLIPEGLNAPGQPQQPGQVPGQPQQLNNAGAGFDDEGEGFEGEGGEGSPNGPNDGRKPGTILSADPNDEFGAPPTTGLQIRGVYAATSGDAVRRFLGKQGLNDWQFTAELYATQKQGGAANPSLLTPFSAWEIVAGNWPDGIVPQTPQPSSEPKQTQKPNQNQNPGQNGRPPRPDLRNLPQNQNPVQGGQPKG